MDNSTAGATSAKPGAQTERTFLGQPWGLANLFGVEMWERFSFYGMQAILVFYMYYAVGEGGLGMDKGRRHLHHRCLRWPRLHGGAVRVVCG